MRIFEWIFAVCGVVAMTVVVSIVVYWMLDDAAPITYGAARTADRAGTASTRFRAGDTLLLTRSYCVRDRQSVDFDRRLVSIDGQVSFSIDTATLVLPKGCVESATRSITIPIWVTPGTYRLVSSGSYVNNPLRRGVFEAPAPVLEVVP